MDEAIVPSRDRKIDEWQPKPNEKANERTNEQSPFLIKPNLFHNFKSTYNDFRNRKFYDYIRAYDIPMPTNDRSMYSNRIAFYCLVDFGKIEIAFLFYKSERAYCGMLCMRLYIRFVVFSTEINYDLFQALEKQSIMIL